MKSEWCASGAHAKLGVAIYSFHGRHDEHLSLDLGDTVQILEECGGWYRGLCLKSRRKGIFPASYVHLRPASVISPGSNEIVISSEDSLVQELSVLLPEWGDLWKNRYFLEERYGMFPTLRKLLMELIEIRTQILACTMPLDELKKLKQKAAAKIDWGNKQMGLDLVPRNEDGDVVDERETSVVQLYHMHQRSTERQKDLQEKRPGSAVVRKSTGRLLEMHHHLFFSMDHLLCRIGEDSELHFFFYDSREQRCFTERFTVRMNKHGMPDEPDQVEGARCLFTDLGSNDLRREEVYIVCHVVRFGSMNYSFNPASGTSSHHSSTQMDYRRPYGCAVLNVSDVLRSSEKSGDVLEGNEKTPTQFREQQVEIFLPEREQDFATLHVNIIKKQAGYKSAPNGARLYISLQLLHGTLSQLKDENPALFERNFSVARKLGFPEIIMPGDVRNDLYITLVSGEFQRDQKKTHKNIEAEICVVSQSGQLVQNCIIPGVSVDKVTTYRGVVIYHNNYPLWEDIIKFDIPFDQFYSAHLRFTFFHRSTNQKSLKGFDLAFVPLMQEDGTTILDGEHNLVMYKCDSSILHKLDPNAYINMPWRVPEGGVQTMHHKGARIVPSRDLKLKIRSLVCSTKLTQNVDLLGLLKWRQHPERLEENLRGMMRVSGEEVVKFLQDTFDALFAIMDQHSERSGQLVFECLVCIIKLLNDRKFEHFRSVLDAYIQKHFSGAMAHEKLIFQLKHCLDDAVNRTNADQNQVRIMQALQYIFKFIITSRLLYSRATRGKNELQFKERLCDLFDTLNCVMMIKDDGALALQAAALQHFSTIIQEVLKIMEPDEFSVIIKSFVDCVPANRLIRFKLLCMGHVVMNDIFRHEECRHILMPLITRQLALYMKYDEHAGKCFDVLGDVLKLLQRKDVGKVYENVQEIMQTLLRSVLRRVCLCERLSSSLSGQTVTCFIAILHLMTEEHYRHFLRESLTKEELMEFLLQCLDVFHNMVAHGSFPRDWLSMLMVFNHVVMKSLKYFSESLRMQFQRGQNFNIELWTKYFDLCVAFITQPSLQLSRFSAAKRNKLMVKYGDMRVTVNREMLNMWYSLTAEQRLRFIPDIVGPFLEVSLIKQEDIRKATIPIFFDMIVCEFVATRDFRQMSSALTDKLDLHVSGAGKGDDEYKELLYNILVQLCSQNKELKKDGAMDFILNSSQLLERLLEFRNIPEGEEHRAARMQTILNLLQYYQEMEREGMYIRYIYKLARLHLESQNFTEAAFTLLLHANLLQWDPSPVDVSAEFPTYASARTQYELKELLYRDIIDYFDKGKLWERAIPLCKELAEQCETVTYDYARLSEIFKTVSELYNNVISTVRASKEYFRVGFYGRGFPPFFRNKQFIFRGQEYERLSDFTQVIMSQFSNAQILSFNTPPSPEYFESEEMSVQCAKVEPVSIDLDKFAGLTVAPSIVEYYGNNNVSRFVLNRPVQRGPKGGNEFANMWVERTVYHTASRLPGVLRWFEVIKEERIEISPLENAVETMVSKNKELEGVISRAELDALQLNPLSMTLNGIIDAAVMGGLANYESAFLTEAYVGSHNEDFPKVELLKELIKDQVVILGKGLDVHARLAPDSVRPLHNKMEMRYEEMRRKYLPSSERRTLTLGDRPRTGSISSQASSTSLTQESPGATRRTTANKKRVLREDRRTVSAVSTDLAAATMLSLGFPQSKLPSSGPAQKLLARRSLPGGYVPGEGKRDSSDSLDVPASNTRAISPPPSPAGELRPRSHTITANWPSMSPPRSKVPAAKVSKSLPHVLASTVSVDSALPPPKPPRPSGEFGAAKPRAKSVALSPSHSLPDTHNRIQPFEDKVSPKAVVSQQLSAPPSSPKLSSSADCLVRLGQTTGTPPPLPAKAAFGQGKSRQTSVDSVGMSKQTSLTSLDSPVAPPKAPVSSGGDEVVNLYSTNAGNGTEVTSTGSRSSIV